MTIIFKEVKDIDTQAIQELFHSVEWKSGDFPEDLRQAINNSHTVITAWDDTKLVGLINALSDGVMTVYFHYMLVHKEYQSLGIGKRMMEQMLSRYSNIKTKVLISYDSAEKFYETFGFKPEEGTKAMFISDMV
ncbi:MULTISPECIES: GNAT family N-acetyltransferase [unclassified Paenibacillus]|uniref:GNAT family N-acetyltransferase n=1 Tax=unclassified Paenibacillus TaxID=185978 RepID=UPI000CFC3183|nr:MULTISPECIES: GNAT family N-acetyltransferase [unclassified Paenibacillus]PRA09461.1 GNAT family N-acetyltransferase [Paenibacillus sp. MYb63]PRA46215.1 GNAT family N-acetyltransferase [Paenibacillus sp. MYb67]QZN73687.1 GNAT family N-acetyltransferase [Paenibacillus sp. DR312]